MFWLRYYELVEIGADHSSAKFCIRYMNVDLFFNLNAVNNYYGYQVWG